MTDKEFERAMKQCGKWHAKYLSALHTIEKEYELRFGIHPSEVSNDFWIDTFYDPPGGEAPTIQQIENSVKIYHRGKV